MGQPLHVFPARILVPKLPLGNTIDWKLCIIFFDGSVLFLPKQELGKEIVNQYLTNLAIVNILVIFTAKYDLIRRPSSDEIKQISAPN